MTSLTVRYLDGRVVRHIYQHVGIPDGSGRWVSSTQRAEWDADFYRDLPSVKSTRVYPLTERVANIGQTRKDNVVDAKKLRDARALRAMYGDGSDPLEAR